MPETIPLTARVAPSVAARLKALAAVEDRSVSYLVAEALERYLADEERQVAEIKAAIAEADAPDASFVTQTDLEAGLNRSRQSPIRPAPPDNHSVIALPRHEDRLGQRPATT